MELFTQNGKMKKSGGDRYLVYNFGIPAYRSKDGFTTCPSAGECSKFCYGKKGHYSTKRVGETYESRLEMLRLSNFSKIASININMIKKRALKRGRKLAIRFFDIGDVYNASVLKKMVDICREQEDVIFYHYTKQVSLIKRYFKRHPCPDNLVSIFSMGGLEDEKIAEGDRHSKVFQTYEQMRAEGYVDASSDDVIAFTSNNHKIGLIYH